jgi:hypothetical protein
MMMPPTIKNINTDKKPEEINCCIAAILPGFYPSV